mmetsp:Transcript_40782/g.73007  ORF Transcript_40782/g.73007 Transcript_40782/m.73007 type:complete len:219 (-) Transcript_40782:592-1248(-)
MCTANEQPPEPPVWGGGGVTLHSDSPQHFALQTSNHSPLLLVPGRLPGLAHVQELVEVKEVVAVFVKAAQGLCDIHVGEFNLQRPVEEPPQLPAIKHPVPIAVKLLVLGHQLVHLWRLQIPEAADTQEVVVRCATPGMAGETLHDLLLALADAAAQRPVEHEEDDHDDRRTQDPAARWVVVDPELLLGDGPAGVGVPRVGDITIVRALRVKLVVAGDE